MPRYHFHVRDGTADLDIDGVELPDLAAVRRETVAFVGQWMLDNTETVWDGEVWKVEVTDHAGFVLYTLVLSAMPASALGLA